jgi:hypothetical protein
MRTDAACFDLGPTNTGPGDKEVPAALYCFVIEAPKIWFGYANVH